MRYTLFTKYVVLDFGGGSPVHVPAAAGALAYTLLLGSSRLRPRTENPRPPNMINMMLGTTLIWVGTLGNNTGSGKLIERNINNVIGLILCQYQHIFM